MSRPALLLLGLFAALYTVTLGTWELTRISECRSGVIIREMLEGHTLYPRTPDGYFLEKPPLYYGLCAALSWVLGVNEWSLRLVSVAMALGTLAVTWFLARLYASERAATLSVAVLGSNVVFLGWARMAMVDMTLTFFITAGLTAFFAARAGRLRPLRASILCGFAFGLAVLSKGPIGIALPLAVILGLLLMETRGRPWKARLPWKELGLAAALAVGIPALWYVPGLLREGREFLETTILSENFYMPLGKARGLGVGHEQPFHYYFGRQLVAMLPMAVFLPDVLRWTWKRRGDAGTRALLGWFGLGFLLFMAASNKRFYYLLPLQPAVSVLVALALERRMEEPGSRLTACCTRGVAVLLGCASLAAFLFAAAPQLADSRVPSDLLALLSDQRPRIVLVAGLALGAAALLFRTNRRPAEIGRTAILFALLAVMTRVWVQDPQEARKNQSRAFVAEMKSKLPPGVTPVVVPPIFAYAVDFYWPERLARRPSTGPDCRWAFVGADLLNRLEGRHEVLGALKDKWEDRTVLLVRRE